MQDNFRFEVVALIIASIGATIVPILFACLIMYVRKQARLERNSTNARPENDWR
jgi:hypothetical protein